MGSQTLSEPDSFQSTHQCIFTCFFWLCRRAARDEGFAEHQDSSSAGHEYLLSLYWAAATMTSTGYGDITPDSTLSYLIAIVTEVGGLLVFGYILATTAATLTNNDAPK